MRHIDHYLTLGKSRGQVFCLSTYNFFLLKIFQSGLSAITYLLGSHPLCAGLAQTIPVSVHSHLFGVCDVT